jgi:peptidyl-tRNA hydrolase, PTH1 family
MMLLVGLGNPGSDHAYTRHNFGHDAIQAFADAHDLILTKHATGAKTAVYAGKHGAVTLATLPTFMNESGNAVLRLKQFYKTPVRHIVIVYDDLALPFGTLRIGHFKSSGGHNGVQSIIDTLDSSDFCRVRLGIAPQQGKAETFVLHQWNATQKKQLLTIMLHVVAALGSIIEKGESDAALFYNKKDLTV